MHAIPSFEVEPNLDKSESMNIKLGACRLMPFHCEDPLSPNDAIFINVRKCLFSKILIIKIASSCQETDFDFIIQFSNFLI